MSETKPLNAQEWLESIDEALKEFAPISRFATFNYANVKLLRELVAEKDAKIAELEHQRDTYKQIAEDYANHTLPKPITITAEAVGLLQRAEAAEAQVKELVSQLDYAEQRAETFAAELLTCKTALREFKQTRGRHDGEHDASLTVCSKCNESYVRAEAKLDGSTND